MSFCTDEEIYEELRKLGHNEVPPEVFDEMKKDLLALVTAEKSFVNDSPTNFKNAHHSKLEGLSRSLKSLNVSREIYDDACSDGNNSSENFFRVRSKQNLWRKVKRPLNYGYQSVVNEDFQGHDVKNDKLPVINSHYSTDSSSALPHSSNLNKKSEPSGNYSKQDGNYLLNYNSLPHLERSQISPRMSRNSNYNPLPLVEESEISAVETDHKSSTNPSADTSLSKYKNILKNYKSNNKFRLDQIDNQDKIYNQTDVDSLSINGKLKRKVLRHKDGKPTITEELVDIPTIFNSSYPETTFDSSFSPSNDLSFKSNSSTGSLVALSPESLTPRSTLSFSTKSRVSHPPRRKKNDPVAMYNYYKKFWDNFKPPGEKNHDKLRWAVRDRMLDYSLS